MGARVHVIGNIDPSHHVYLATGPDLPPQKWLTVEARLPRLLQEAGAEGVGRILDEITSNGVTGDTLIVFTSDHGLCCGHHGIGGKGNGTLPLNMVEEAIRVPLVMWRPDHLLHGVRRREFVDHLDLFLTILDCAGINAGTTCDSGLGMYPGRSFLPLLANCAAGRGGVAADPECGSFTSRWSPWLSSLRAGAPAGPREDPAGRTAVEADWLLRNKGDAPTG